MTPRFDTVAILGARRLDGSLGPALPPRGHVRREVFGE
jgi:hypothetical protein